MPTIIEHTQIGPEMRAVLRWELQEEKRDLFLKANETAQIGRDRDNDLYLNDELISRHHALIAWKEDGFVLKDLGSTNGTLVNGEKIDFPRQLIDGDNIQIGDIALKYHELRQPKPEFGENYQGNETFIVRKDVAQPRLITSAGPHEGKEYLIQAGKMQVGRATSKATWDISLNDKAVSRPHAEICQKTDQTTIKDLGSANGSYVNGEQISETIEMQDGDVIVIGETTLLFRNR